MNGFLPVLAAVLGSLGSSTSQLSKSGSFEKLLEGIKDYNKNKSINRIAKMPQFASRFGRI